VACGNAVVTEQPQTSYGDTPHGAFTIFDERVETELRSVTGTNKSWMSLRWCRQRGPTIWVRPRHPSGTGKIPVVLKNRPVARQRGARKANLPVLISSLTVMCQQNWDFPIRDFDTDPVWEECFAQVFNQAGRAFTGVGIEPHLPGFRPSCLPSQVRHTLLG
jgi:hypothetical protein